MGGRFCVQEVCRLGAGCRKDVVMSTEEEERRRRRGETQRLLLARLSIHVVPNSRGSVVGNFHKETRRRPKTHQLGSAAEVHCERLCVCFGPVPFPARRC